MLAFNISDFEILFHTLSLRIGNTVKWRLLKTRAVKKLMCATCYTFHLETVLQYKSLFQQNIALMNSLKECVLQLSVKKNKRYHEICHIWKGIDHYYQMLFDEPYPVC